MKSKLISCKSCGHEIAKNAKICPQCGAKNKKPIFKKWWFWAILVLLIIGSIGSDNDADGTNTKNVESQALSTTPEIQTNSTAQESTQAEVVTTESVTPAVELTMGQKNALSSAKNYLSFSAFSYEGLISQLEFEKYTYEDAVFAADNCGADWNEQALKSAKNYLSFSAFSYSGLIRQLEFEKYTNDQAVYAADNCGADWNEQAAKSAKNYLSFSSFSRDGLIGQLEFEGFTREQAEYGVTVNGY